MILKSILAALSQMSDARFRSVLLRENTVTVERVPDTQFTHSNLNFLEQRVGNALPDPTTLFALLALAVVVLSGIAAQFDLSVTHPTTGQTISPVSLLSIEGLHRILTQLVTNFTSFAPLGTVLVAMIGIGVAEVSGLIGAIMRMIVLRSPRALKGRALKRTR